ncbi:hydroxyacid dehydrogenase [Acetobacter sp. TBRC 12305]|uniref:Hydroxyacid dehydrogenase n=1 Tax=Acetobacter garciniae TaxID=2817435 RepID=A0A939HMN9_9PROT|nr:hydroxyacid dehydrogenase [Acetobacter garciniae]MBX0344127.1 hydroxyacid dehydrogenase [Acetobacter garciniae]
MECFITQPVHDSALTFLKEHGIAVRHATVPDMETVVREIGAADAVITRDIGLSRDAIAAAPHLRIISCHGVGTNRIDMAAAQERGITVTNTPGVNSQSVAELTIGLMLASARDLCRADHAVRQHDWQFRYTCEGMELHGKTLGLVGFGAIARKVAVIAGAGLGMRVIAWSPSMAADCFAQHGVERCNTLEELLGRSDVVSIHRAGKQDDPPLMTQSALRLMQPHALLINVGRGFAIDQDALARILAEKRIRGAALDVMRVEPPAEDDPLLCAPALLLTPHLGGTTQEALQRMALTCAQQVLAALSGLAPEHRVGLP